MTRREWLVLTGCSALAGCAKRPFSLAFAPSNEEHGNPERGFYVQRAAEDFGDAADIRGYGVTLVLLTLDLKHYRNRRLDEAKLSVLDDATAQALAYAWADPDAERIGINLGWVQVGLERNVPSTAPMP